MGKKLYLILFLQLLSIIQVQSLYSSDSKVIKLTTADFHNKVIRSKQPWMIEFYGNILFKNKILLFIYYHHYKIY